MSLHIKTKEAPNCVVCGKKMDNWNPFVSSLNQEHPECTAERVSIEMMKRLKKQLNKNRVVIIPKSEMKFINLK